MTQVSYQDANFLRSAIILLNQFNNLRIPLRQPVSGALSAAAGGGGTSNLANGTYYVKITAIDANGNESIAGNEQSAAVAGGTTNNQLVFAAGTNIPGAASYRVYRSTTSGSYSGYYTRTTTQFAAGWTDNGAGAFVLTGTSAPPTVNAAYYQPLQDSIINPLTTVQGLIDAINNAPVHYTDKNYGRKLVNLINTLTTLSGRFPVPAKPTCAGVGSGSGYTLGAGTYYFIVTAIDDQGRESVASAESNGFTVTNQDSITISYTNVTNAVKHRVYRGSASGGENVYFEDTTSPFSDTGTAGTAGSPPSALTSNAGPSVLTDAKVAAADTFQGLLDVIAQAANPNLDTTLSAGEQSE